jgi:hypothetical protein
MGFDAGDASERPEDYDVPCRHEFAGPESFPFVEYLLPHQQRRLS